MFLSKASVVLVSILGTTWFTGDTFVTAGPLPQGYNEQMLQGYNQQMPQGLNQLMPQGYNQHMQQGYNQLMPQSQPETRYVYVNLNPQPMAPVYQQQPQVIYANAPSASRSDNIPPLIKTWNGMHDWAQNGVQALLGQNPPPGRK